MLERIDATSEQRWGKDLDAIKATGFSTVKTWIDWASAEPRQAKYSFANLDLLLQLAQQRNMRVIVQLYLDSAPDWVARRFPDARFVDRSGAVIDPQSAPGYCIDNAALRREIVNLLQALSQDANRYSSLFGWDVWSEPHVINWAEFPYLRNPEFCFCDASQARFREWLKQKYKTLAALNAAWYRQFESWDQVHPPRYPTILSYTDYLDWRAFIDDKLAGDLKTRVDAIRSADKTHPITSHAAAPGLFTSPTDGYGEPDDWKMSANADFFGTSLYPKHSESIEPWSFEKLAAGLDFTRSAGHSFGKGFWIGELQAGQGATGMRIADPVTAQDERFWMWQVVAHGARELAIYAWYPMSSGFESNGYGLINLDGSITDRARAAGEVAKVIDRYGADILNTKPAPAQIGILYNRLSYMVGGSQPSLSKLGNGERDSLMGLYRAFFEKQIPVDFVFPEDVVQQKIGAYKILFVPFPVMLAKNVAEALKQYIEDGGTVVAEARLAWNDERGYASPAIPGFGLDRVFGAREKLIRPVARPLLTLSSGSGGAIPGDAYEEALEPLPGARVLAHFRDGEPGVISNSWGKGKAILVGSFLGLSYNKQPDENLRSFLLSLAQSAGVTQDVSVSGPGTSALEVRRLLNPREQLVFVFNHGQQPADCTLAMALPFHPGKARDLMDQQTVPFESRGGQIVFNKALAAGAIWVFRLEAPRAE